MTLEEQVAALTARVEALEAELSKKRRSVFKPPTEAQVLAYAHSRGRVIDAAHFIDHYESKGWMVGKVKMRRWQSAVSNWIRNAPKFEPTRHVPLWRIARVRNSRVSSVIALPAGR